MNNLYERAGKLNIFASFVAGVPGQESLSTLGGYIRSTLLFCLIPAVLLGGFSAVFAEDSPGTQITSLSREQNVNQRIIDETPEKILWVLPDKKNVWISKKPKRVVVLLTSLLHLWYETDGQAIARCSGKLHVPKQALGLPEVGTFNNPNAEKIIALQPDLVISSNLPAFRRLIPILEENKIQYAYFNYINFYDYNRILTLFSKLNHTEDRVRQLQEHMTEKIEAIQASIKGFKAPRVLVAFSTANSVSCEVNGSQTCTMLSMLGAENIIPDRFSTRNRTRIQFSLERIVCLDPDIILLNTMGDVDECRDRLETEFSGNQAWAGLRAIKENRFFVLPKEYFLYKPNAGFPDALQYLADLLYGKRI